MNSAPPDSNSKLHDLHAIRDSNTGTTGKNQAARLLQALGRYTVTSYEASRHLDVYHCPARILELRQAGHEIDTHWQTVETESGAKHRIGKYVLRRAQA